MPGFEEIIQVAKGAKKADTVLRNGKLVNVLSGEIYSADVAIFQGKVIGIGSYQGNEEIDLKGLYFCPGFIDGHVHIESSMVTIPEFAKAVVPLGTTSVIIDPHEIANVLGIEGIQYMLKSSKFNPLNVFIMLPSCVPATPFETSGSNLRAFDLYPFLSEKWVLGLGEVMNYPGVLAQDSDLLDKIAMVQTKKVDGHAPGLLGRDLCAYIAAGVSSDHEGTTVEEAKEKLRMGMYIMLREGSATKNLLDLLPLINHQNIHRCFLVTDDRHPKDILEEGHINHLIKLALKHGLDPISAIRLGTINTASYFGLKELGAIAPGFDADIVAFDNFENFKIKMVFKKGEIVAREGEFLKTPVLPSQIKLRSTVNIKWLLDDDLRIPVGGDAMRVIELVPNQIITKERIEPPKVVNGYVESDLERDILKSAVFERHHASEKIGLGFVKGFGLKRGAIGSSIAHDSHNIVVVGTNDEDMLQAAIEISKLQGGLVIIVDKKPVDSLRLPIAGLMSEKSLFEVKENLDHLHERVLELGSTLGDPFTALSFLALPVVPELKLTDQGLVDVRRFEFVDLFV